MIRANTTERKDFTNGKVAGKMIRFAIPMAIATLLQLLFNAADTMIVGQAQDGLGDIYVGAVGATTTIIHLVTNLFVGISVGANVAMARAFGAKDENAQHRVVHSSVALSILCGFVVLVAGVITANPLLVATGTPSQQIDYSTTYLIIYFLGAPALMVYNFCAAIMRGVGETKKPLMYLVVSGIVNIVVNFITVILLNMNVVGVALATILSQYVSAIWILIDLSRMKNGAKLSIKKIRFYKKETLNVFLTGVPIGINSSLFSLSNVLVMSNINAFGPDALTGNTIAVTLEGFNTAFSGAVGNSVVTFVGQNIGAKKPERIMRIIGAGLLICGIATALFGVAAVVFGREFAHIYTNSEVIVELSLKRTYYTTALVVLTTPMEVFGGSLKASGYSVLGMLINLFFTCVVRVIYFLFVYPFFPQSMQIIEMVFVIYPVTWALSALGQMIMFFFVAYPGVKKQHASEVAQSSETLQENQEQAQNSEEKLLEVGTKS